MKLPTFNLVDEPWIIVTKRDGANVVVSMRELFATCDDIVDIAATPQTWIGIVRTLVCILQRAVAPKRVDDIHARITGGLTESDKKRVDDYLTKWHRRFDLFDEKRPFLQVPELDPRAEDIPAIKLLLVKSVGKAARLMDWSKDALPVPMKPAEAAAALLGAQACAVQGGNSMPWWFMDAPCSAVTSYMMICSTLDKTLSAQLLVPEIAREVRTESATDEDAPTWEWRELLDPGTEQTTKTSYARGARGYMDHLSWTSRAVKLVPEIEGDQTVVKIAKIRQGHWIAVDDREALWHPWGLYRAAKDGKIMPLSVGFSPPWLMAYMAIAGGDDLRRRPLPLAAAFDDTRLRSQSDVFVGLRLIGVEHKKSVIKLIVSDETRIPDDLETAEKRAKVIVEKVAKTNTEAMASMSSIAHNAAMNGRDLDAGTMKKLRERARASGAAIAMLGEMRSAAAAYMSSGDEKSLTDGLSLIAWRARRRFADQFGKSPRALIAAAKSGV